MMASREGTKVHSGGRLLHAPSTIVSGEEFSFTGGSTGIIKFLEPLSPMLNYYEYEILEKGQEASIGIGVGHRDYPMSRMPGWNRNSVGYHADDGKLYHENGLGVAFGPTCTTGDRMGCGVDFSSDDSSGYLNVFFTKNDQHIGHLVRMRRPPYGLYPLIGLHSRGEKVRYLGHWCRTADGLQEPMEVEHSPAGTWLRCNGVKFLGESTLLEYNGTTPEQIQDVGIAQAKFPLSPTNHYFELQILARGNKGAIAIGVAKATYPLHRHPGWNPGAVGYHADDGKVFVERGQGEPFGPTCTEGDTMGCGIKFTDKPKGREEEKEENQASGLQSDNSSDESDSDSDDLYLSSDEDGDDIDELVYQQMLEAEMARDRDMFGLFGGGRRRLGRGGLGGYRQGLRRRFAARLNREDKICSEDRSGQKCTVYFTKNGDLVGERVCDMPKGGFYPVVAMLSKGERIRVDLNPLSG